MSTQVITVKQWEVQPPGHGPSIVQGVLVQETADALLVRGWWEGNLSQYTHPMLKAHILRESA